MSNATNVTFNVTVNSEEVEPKLTFTPGKESDVSMVLVSSKAVINFTDSTDESTSSSATIDISGLVGKNSIYLFNVSTDSTLLSKLSPLYPTNNLVSGSSIGVLKTKPITANSIDIESFPIISINNFSIIDFDTWWSLLNFPSSVSQSTVSEVKSKIQAIYPPLFSPNKDDPLYPVVTQLQSDIQSGIVSMNSIIDRLTSIKVGSTYIDPSHVLFSKTNSSLPIGNPTHTYTVINAEKIRPVSIEYQPITNYVDAFIDMNSGSDLIASNQTLFSGGWQPLTNIAKMTKPSSSQAATWISDSTGFQASFPNGMSNPGVYLSTLYTGYYSTYNNGSLSTNTTLTPPVNTNASTGYTLYTSNWWSSFNVGTKYQISGDGDFANSVNAMTPFIVPYSTVPDSAIEQVIDQMVNFVDWSGVITGQALGIILLLQNDTGDQVEWNLVSNAKKFANKYFSTGVSSSTWDNLSAQLSVFGYSLSANGGIDDSTTDSIAYSYSGSAVPFSKCFTISSVYGTYVNYSIHNFSINDLSVLKEIVSAKEDPFEVIADKALTLRDEFNAKVLSDINCKVMNFPTIENVINNFSNTITYFNSLTDGTIPLTNQVYSALTPIFIGSLNLGTYFSLIQDLYECWPYTSIPPTVELAWSNIQNTYKWNQDFPWSEKQLSMLINWLFLLPSPTSVKASSTSIQTYTLNTTYHIFTTSNKPVTRYVPDHKLTMELSDCTRFDPSVNEVKNVMNALEDISTCLLAASTGYTSAKNAESMLKSILKNNKLSSLEELSTSNDPSVQALYTKFSTWWTQTFHSKSNSVSSQFDHYESCLFTPDSSNHKKQLAKHMGDLHSIFDAISLSTFKNSDILGQVSQMASNVFTKHHDALVSTMGKLGTDLLADDSLKLLDHAVEDVVHNSLNIAADVGKVILNMTTDILATAADLLSPVSVVTQLYNDLDEHIYNGFSQVPDVNSTLFNGSATTGTPWAFSLTSIPNMFAYKDGKYTAFWPSDPNQYFIQGGLVGPNYVWPSKASINTINASSSILVPYNEWYWGWSSQGAPSINMLSFRCNDMSLNKPLRFTFHTSVGDAFIYVLNGVSYNKNSNVWSSSNGLSDIIVEPEPVRNFLGVIDPLRTVKKMVEIIYQLPRLFGCSGLFDYSWYKDLWSNFISDVGSQAWLNDQPHVATNEILAADSAGMGMALGYTAYAAVEGASFNWSSMIENGIIAVTDATEVGLYTNKVDQINSEPNILSNMAKVSQFLSVVMRFIFDWKFAMNGGLLSYLKANKSKFDSQLYDSYQNYCSLTLDENEKNRKLCQILNDYYYGTGVGDFSSHKPWMVDTIPNLGDLTYDTQFLGVKVNMDSNYRWNDKQVAQTQVSDEGNIELMGPVYSPSILRDFMVVTAGLGRIAAGAFLEKRTAQLFLAHAKLSKKLAYIRAKVKKITAAPTKLAKWIGNKACAKYHRDHNSKSRAKLINAQTSKLESTLTTQTNTLAGDISGINTGMSDLTFGFH